VRVRLDKFLVEEDLVQSRQRAHDLIVAGQVKVDGKVVTKAGHGVLAGSDVRVEGDELRWVSKGGLKLERAMDQWGIGPQGWTCLDVGASTGGFTDVLLTLGAAKVYAVDVGHGQLDEKLRSDGRVVNFEKVNARQIDAELIGEAVDFICIDVSFISLELVLPGVVGLLKAGGEMVALIKPQFEVGAERVGKNGIIRDEKLWDVAIERVRRVSREIGLCEVGVIAAGAAERGKNREFLIYLKREE